MATPNEPATVPSFSDIPPFAKSLAPYVKTRQEALRIRQALTSHLRSQIIFADNDPEHPDCLAQSHLSLCVPDDAVSDVKHIPAEFTGLRREYLQALQANVAARKEKQLISERLAAVRSQAGGCSADSSLHLQAYLRLVRDRRRHAKLQVFEHYLNELRARDALRPEDFENKKGLNQLTLNEEFEDREQDNGVSGDVNELVQKLEKAVIRAKSQLDREKRLYEDLKARKASEPADEPALAVKAAALQQTRDELVHWVEEKIVSSESSEGPVEELPAEEIEESARILEEQRVRILQQYTMYTETRKRLLEVAAQACQPVSIASAKSTPRLTDQVPPKDEIPPIEPLEVLSYASDVLHPVSKTQRSLALQKFYLSGMLAKERSNTLRMLNRLRDESHLLPEYPILARQPRFKHAAAALNSRRAANQADTTKQDPIVEMAEAWAFASAAAGSNEKEYIEQKVEDGSNHTTQAERALQKVYNLLDQDLEGALGDEKGEDRKDDDLWAQEAHSIRPSTKSSRFEKRSKGPWTRFNGRVGVAD